MSRPRQRRPMNGARSLTFVLLAGLLTCGGEPTGPNPLDAVASVLIGSYAGKTIRVGGHTDRDPIRKSGFKSNYHLGFERGYAVRDYLVKKGVASERIYLASYGPNRPRGTKSKSRLSRCIALVN